MEFMAGIAYDGQEGGICYNNELNSKKAFYFPLLS